MASHYDLKVEWETSFNDVKTAVVPGGHFLPEESPDELLALVIPFSKHLPSFLNGLEKIRTGLCEG